MEDGTFELNSRTAKSSTMEKRQSTRALQQRIQPKRDITNAASWISYCKLKYHAHLFHPLHGKPTILSFIAAN
jgi:hypothetical protein